MTFGGVSRGSQSSIVVLKSGFSLNQFTNKDECLQPLLESLLYGMKSDSAILYQGEAPYHAT
jgi:hypothetical protein